MRWRTDVLLRWGQKMVTLWTMEDQDKVWCSTSGRWMGLEEYCGRYD